MNFKNIVILGAGESGTGAAILAKSRNYNVFVSDNNTIKSNYKDLLVKNNIEFEENNHTKHKILCADLIIKSPGIPDTMPLIKEAELNKIKIIDELEFAAWFTKGYKICITGSNGKTTTSKLIYHILQKSGLNAGLVGNIGNSFSKQIIESDKDIYVIEVSSFQLDRMYDFKADIAILTNITADHLDRYEYNIENYITSKFKIIQNQNKNDYFIYSNDNEVIRKKLKNKKIQSNKIPFSIYEINNGNGAFIKDKSLVININSKIFTMEIESLALQGRHNIYNSMAAGITSKIMEIRNEIIKESMSDFQGVEHRMEFIAKVHGIEFINDSKATNVNSTWYALECMTKPVIWIVGGQDKGNDYSSLRQLVKSKVKGIICLGKDNKKIIDEFSSIVPVVLETRDMIEAVEKAYYSADTNDVVLLSPACASFDLFENFEDRGNQFRKAVNDL